MNIFEDDDDCERFMGLLLKHFQSNDVSLYAWCLMSNHVHLLVHGRLSDISRGMKCALGRYAVYFNSRHGHVGHLFQGRFRSNPVLDDSQLLATLRYIHNNPVEAGISSSEDYRWSSCKDYCGEGPGYTACSFVLGILGGNEGFLALESEMTSTVVRTTPKELRKALSDREAKKVAESLLGKGVIAELASSDRDYRNRSLARLRATGLSVRQIERITGIGRGIIQRVGSDAGKERDK